MRERPWSSRTAITLVVVASATVVSACGSGDHTRSSTGAVGAQIFISAGCSSCHTLAAAHAHGQVGPNLDELRPDLATVERQVRTGGAGMPAFAGALSPAQIRAVAQYVATTSRAGAP